MHTYTPVEVQTHVAEMLAQEVTVDTILAALAECCQDLARWVGTTPTSAQGCVDTVADLVWIGCLLLMAAYLTASMV